MITTNAHSKKNFVAPQAPSGLFHSLNYTFLLISAHPATKIHITKKCKAKKIIILHCSTTFHKARSTRWKLRRKKRPQSGAQVHCFRKSWSNHHLDKTGKIFCIFFAKKISAELIKSVGTFGCNKFELEERCKLNTFVTF